MKSWWRTVPPGDGRGMFGTSNMLCYHAAGSHPRSTSAGVVTRQVHLQKMVSSGHDAMSPRARMKVYRHGLGDFQWRRLCALPHTRFEAIFWATVSGDMSRP